MFKNYLNEAKNWFLAVNAYFSVKYDLGRLSERQLQDIGISRSEIDFYAQNAYLKARGYNHTL